jgi:hypothetical protein
MRLSLKFKRQDEEFPNVWRYTDPFVGSLDIRKVELPDRPPLYIAVTVEWAVVPETAS